MAAPSQAQERATTGAAREVPEELSHLTFTRDILARHQTDPEFNKILSEQRPLLFGEHGPEYEVFRSSGKTIEYKQVFITLVSRFDPSFKQAIKRSYTQKELVEFFDHFSNLDRFQSKLQTAIAMEALSEHSPGQHTPGEGGKEVSTEENEAFKKELERKKKETEQKNEGATWARRGVIEEEEAESPKITEIGSGPKTKLPDMPAFGEVTPDQQKIPRGARTRRVLSKAAPPVRSFFSRIWVGVGLPLVGWIKKRTPKSRGIPALAGAAVGLAVLGPVGAPAGAALGFFLGDSVLSPFMDRGRAGPTTAPASPQPSSPGQTESPGGGPASAQEGPQAPSRPKRTPPRANPLSSARKLLGGPFGSTKKYWIIGGLVFLAIVLFIMFLSNPDSGGSLGGSGAPAPTLAPTGGGGAPITLTLEGPDTSSNGDSLGYTITFTYTGDGTADIEIDDPLPSQTTLSSASDGGGDQAGTVKWTFSGVLPNQPKTLSVAFRPSADIWVTNTATAILLDSTAGTVAGPVSVDNCSGKYSLANPIGNFGDAGCNFTKQQLFTLLQQQDPAHASYWFFTVVDCESGYNPNAFADHLKVGTPDSAGAWGLFQMGRGKNGQYDHGDVNWDAQISNAVNYKNKVIGGSFAYWACAK